MKIFFIADLNEYGRSFQRFKTLKDVGHEVIGLSYAPIPFIPGTHKEVFWDRLLWKLSLPRDPLNINRSICNSISGASFDVVWIEKGNIIKPRTLKFIKEMNPKIYLVSCSEDDMYASHNNSFYYKRGLKYYDVVFTTKLYNLEELKKYGASRVELFLDAYDQNLHKTLVLNEEDLKKFSSDVSFVGTFEEDRAKQMLFLAESGIKVVVWGNGWDNWVNVNNNLIIKNEPVYNENYVKVINASKINLGFLRKRNRDEVTSRSVEIPACGAFLLAERTARHLQFFKQGEEADFFSSKEELLSKVRFYLQNEDKRKEIALAGKKRCLLSGYSHKEQLISMLAMLGI